MAAAVGAMPASGVAGTATGSTSGATVGELHGVCSSQTTQSARSPAGMTAAWASSPRQNAASATSRNAARALVVVAALRIIACENTPSSAPAQTLTAPRQSVLLALAGNTRPAGRAKVHGL